MSTVLVTGALGLLGSTLVPYLKSTGYDILLHSRKGNTEILGDLSDFDQARVILNQALPEVIINLAALTNVDHCEDAPQFAYMANVRIVENLVKWIQENDSACHLVQMSTDQVYDGMGPHIEEDVVLTNYYGFSKYAGELVAASVDSTILRTNFFGSGKSLKPSLSDWLVRSLSENSPITVFDNIYFSPLSLSRLVEMIVLVIEQRCLGVFNLGSREGMSKADFAFALAEVLGFPSDRMIRGSLGQNQLRACRPHDMRMDSSKFENAFNICLPTLEEEIRSMKGVYAYEAS